MTADTPGAVRTVRLCLLGFGHAARRLCELLAEREAELGEQQGVRFLVTAVGTAHHGSLHSAAGLAPARVLALAQGDSWSFPGAAMPGVDVVRGSGADVLVEATTLEHGGHAATAHLEAAFSSGMDAVTVNKGPIAWAYRRVREAADRHGRRLRFEGVVMDGCPVFSLVERCLPGATVTGVHGVLNATTNHILDAMADGVDLDTALAVAQREGFAEADPSHDIDGHDAAAKVAALANVLMAADITPEQVARVSIRDVTAEQVVDVRSRGHRLRVGCRAERAPDGTVTGSVALTEVGPDHPYFAVTGSSSVVVVQTDLMGDVEIVERDGLLTQTAYALYADLLTLYATPHPYPHPPPPPPSC